MVTIEENKVPLVESMTSNYDGWFIVTVSLMLFIVVTYLLGTYIQLCNIKRRRVKELLEFYQMKGYMGWNIFKLQREIKKLEGKDNASIVRK